ncbi:IclR family transcriptional regulator [Natrialba sp. SSL1]|uniref:IclR family transcriptional regulator n=1 Tax=Natrialba sp. SSL1 TaxID=1869245 RepID=UPI000A04707D|nr:IclR family transcriptional regulator [Natrialba sp. SSL1]
MTNDNQILSTTETSIRVIEEIQRQNGLRANELAEALDLSISTVYKHLSTLMKHSLIIRDGDIYQLGVRFYDLGMYVRGHNQLYRIAGKHVSQMANQSNEEVDFGIEQNGRLITLYDTIGGMSEPSHRPGYYQYLHTTAIGKSILAKYNDEEIRAIIEKWGLPRVTDYSITSREALFEEIELVRNRGYAINDQESQSGKRVVGMAVEHPEGTVIGGFSICGPEYRISDDELHQELVTVLDDGIKNFKSELESQLTV